MTALRTLQKVQTYIDRYGWRSAVRRGRGEIGRLITGKDAARIANRGRVIEAYEAILGHDQGTGDPDVLNAVPRDSITWLVPDFSPGSGGHTTIFRFLHGLEKRGWHNQTVVVQKPYRWANPDDALNTIRKHFFPLEHTRVVLGAENIPPSRFLFATGWQTANWVAKYKDAVNRFYFVQDFEPSFYAMGTDHLLAEATYRLGLKAITAGDWLKDKLAADYGMETQSISFSCDHDIYAPAERPDSGAEKTVFFYARPATSRRAFELGLLALNRVCQARGGVTVLFAGWDLDGYKIPFPHVDAKVVTPAALADMFRKSDAALVLSTTNLSLMPLEILSTGCPLIINRGANNEWLIDESVATVCDLTVEGIAEATLAALAGGAEIKAKRENGLAFSRNTDWDREAEKLNGYLNACP